MQILQILIWRIILNTKKEIKIIDKWTLLLYMTYRINK